MAKTETSVETVKMLNGTVIDFPGKRQMQKSSTIAPDGTVAVTMDFRNGETRVFAVPSTLMGKFAAHGAEQKLGDQIAGLKGKDGGEADIDDKIYAIEELMDRLSKGEWTQAATSNGMAGMSILAKALMEFGGKTSEQIKSFLADKTHAQKVALRANPKVKVIVERLEAEKAAKASAKPDAVDTDALLGELG